MRHGGLLGFTGVPQGPLKRLQGGPQGPPRGTSAAAFCWHMCMCVAGWLSISSKQEELLLYGLGFRVCCLGCMYSSQGWDAVQEAIMMRHVQLCIDEGKLRLARDGWVEALLSLSVSIIYSVYLLLFCLSLPLIYIVCIFYSYVSLYLRIHRGFVYYRVLSPSSIDCLLSP